MNRTRVRLRSAAAALLAGSLVSVSALPAPVALPFLGLLAVTGAWWLVPAERFDLLVTPASTVARRAR